MEQTEEEYKQFLLESYQGDIDTAVDCLNRSFEGEMMELKPCPFCGSEPELGLHGPLVDGEPRIAIWCVSGKCPMDDVGGNNFDTEEAAIKAWNTRTPDTGEEE